MGCSAYTNILVDIRMGIEFAGRNLFFSAPKKRPIEKVHHCAYVSNMGRKKIPEDQKATKPGVSLNKECRIILSKIMEYETSLRNDLAQSQAIRKCMLLSWDLHYKALFEKYEKESTQKSSSKASKVSPAVGAEMATLSGSLGSGSSKASTETSRRAS